MNGKYDRRTGRKKERGEELAKISKAANIILQF